MIVLKDFLMGICGASTATSVGLGIYYGIRYGSKNEEETSNNGKDETEKEEQGEEKENKGSGNGSDSSSSILQPLIPEAPVSDTSGSGDGILIVKK